MQEIFTYAHMLTGSVILLPDVLAVELYSMRELICKLITNELGTLQCQTRS